MTIHNFALHRANSPVNMPGPYEQVKYYVSKGFTKLEIDIYALTDTTYKFCHPLDRDRINEIHDIHDEFLTKLVKEFPTVEWYVDLKCLDLDIIPKEMLRALVATFGSSAIFIAAQQEILEFVHAANLRTGQYFRDESKALNYEPDFYIQSTTGDLRYPKEKTILFCDTLDKAFEYRVKGFPHIMIEGHIAIANDNI